LRKCSICGSSKTYIDKRGCECWHIDKDGGLFICSRCRAKKYQEAHKEERRKHDHVYYQINRSKVLECNRRYRKAHEQEEQERDHMYYRANRSKILERHREYRRTHSDQMRGYNRRRVDFKGRSVPVESVPRTGQCSMCGRRIEVDDIKKTNMHHDEYHQDDVLKDTREFCVPCHHHG
jgi:hypothetical protein